MTVFQFCPNVCCELINITSGIVIYKKYESTWRNPLNFDSGRAKCEEDSNKVSSVSDFLHLPMPQNEDENKIYHEIVKDYATHVYLDITEVKPQTQPRSWELKNGTSAMWFNWVASPSKITVDKGGLNKPYIQLLRDTPGGKNVGGWVEVGAQENSMTGEHELPKADTVCTYFLPAYSIDYCPWLRDLS